MHLRSHIPLLVQGQGWRRSSVQQLRDDAAQAAQRATSADVKVEVLQKAVQQAEERAAALEMQVWARYTVPCYSLTFLDCSDRPFSRLVYELKLVITRHDSTVQVQSRTGLVERCPGWQQAAAR